MYARTAAKAYAQTGMQTGAMSASPHQLITMLYDGARGAIARAKYLLAMERTATVITDKGKAISHAINIIDNGLRAVLDHPAGGELSANLEQIYEYMTRRLMLANVRNDVGMLDEVDRLLEGLATAWAQSSPVDAAAAQPVLVEN